jgi:hypothetical protein
MAVENVKTWPGDDQPLDLKRCCAPAAEPAREFRAEP